MARRSAACLRRRHAEALGGLRAGVDQDEEVEQCGLAAAGVAEHNEGAPVAAVQGVGDRLTLRQRAAPALAAQGVELVGQAASAFLEALRVLALGLELEQQTPFIRR